jgi:hypothetical protein
MTSQKYGLMHTIVRTLVYNYEFDVDKIPNKILKAAAKNYDEYLRLYRKEVGEQTFMKSRERQVLQKVFVKMDQLGYYQYPLFTSESGESNAN